jgi:hypothetical protein
VVEISDDRRSDNGRRVAALLVAGVIVAATVAGLWTVARRVALPTNGLIERDEIVPWDGALLDGDRLTLYFTGAPPLKEGDACSRAYDAAAQPANDRVVVTIHAFAGSRLLPGQGCEDIGYERSVTLELEEPLQGRTAVDGGSGQRRRVSDAVEVLTPSWGAGWLSPSQAVRGLGRRCPGVGPGSWPGGAVDHRAGTRR